MMDLQARIFVAGHNGLVGSAIARALRARGARNLITRARAELDLADQRAVASFFERERPDVVFLAAAKVGGISANNSYPAEFIQDNLAIQTNVIDSAWKHGTSKFCFIGSSCIYPRDCPQPIREEYLLSGPLEPTNAPYAIAKIAGLMMCQSYLRQYGFDAISVMPTNLYGPGDSFHPENSHVLPAMIRRFHEAMVREDPSVAIWGSGQPRREFMHVDDLADATVFLAMNHSGEQIINIGMGEDISILELAVLVASIVGYTGRIDTDPTKPDGTPRKLLDVSRLRAMGWSPGIQLREGIESTYRWWLAHRGADAPAGPVRGTS